MYGDDCEGVTMHSKIICRSGVYMYDKLIIYKSTCAGQDFPLGICKVMKFIKESQGNLWELASPSPWWYLTLPSKTKPYHYKQNLFQPDSKTSDSDLHMNYAINDK